MSSPYGSFRAFGEQSFSNLVEDMLARMRERVQQEDPDYVRGVAEGEYVNHLVVSEFTIPDLMLDVDGTHVSGGEDDIPAEWHPNDFAVERGETYRRSVVVYHIPLGGEIDLLRYHPNPGGMSPPQVSLGEGELTFQLIDFYGDGRGVGDRGKQTLDVLRQLYESLRKNIATYNQELPGLVTTAVRQRRQQLGDRRKVLETFGLPMKKSANIPETFAIPQVRKKIPPRPPPAKADQSPDPTLDDTVYRDILQTIHDTGKAFERLPSTYADKDEETLRDHFILVLEPRYEGATTGETFNKSGKTDILIQHAKSNVFVAECKIWRGEKQHLAAIDQILSYLTWRDSKTALIYFVKGKEIAPVLKAIEASTPTHPNFVALRGRPDESWFDYEFHLPGDRERSVKLAVLCFHFSP